MEECLIDKALIDKTRILQRAFSYNMQLSILEKLLKIKHSSTLLKK